MLPQRQQFVPGNVSQLLLLEALMSCLALPQVTLAERGVWPQKTLTLERRGKSTHPRNALLKLPTCSLRAGSKVQFCGHCSCCASCTGAVSRCLLRRFLVDVMKQINLRIPVLSNQLWVLGRTQAQISIPQISHLAVVQNLPEL